MRYTELVEGKIYRNMKFLTNAEPGYVVFLFNGWNKQSTKSTIFLDAFGKKIIGACCSIHSDFLNASEIDIINLQKAFPHYDLKFQHYEIY